MATEKQRAAARKNVRSAAKAAKSKKTIAEMPKQTRTALGKQGLPWRIGSAPAARNRRPGKSCIARHSDEVCPGVRRWDATNLPAL